MSFIDDIIDVGSSVVDFFTSNDLVSSLATTAITAYALNQITNSINRDNEATQRDTQQADSGARIQIKPNPEASIPVVYGRATVNGIITDAQLTNSNRTMHYVITLSEKTGTKLSDSSASSIAFREIYWNNERLIFDSDGITVAKSIDSTGAENTNIAGLIKVYCFNNGSTSPVAPYNYTNGSLSNAYSIMPGWTSDHTMDELVFAIVRMDYSSENKITSLGDWKFNLQNSMYLPGDCLYDYMKNTRYGAGIPDAEIYSS